MHDAEAHRESVRPFALYPHMTVHENVFDQTGRRSNS
jgi:ABC-type polar amino acid transport system ATPase subunit